MAITRERELEKKKQEKKKFKVLKEFLNSRKHIEEEGKAALEDAEQQKVVEIQQDYDRRRALQLAELNVSQNNRSQAT